ncbi:MAG: LytTR family DNA-binding domain-containing protein [Ferruginibacter sp.]
MIKCIIVDDEPVARLGLVNYLNKIPSAELVASLNNAMQLPEYFINTNPDLLLLDIEMPQLNGMEFLKTKQNMPLTIIVTAYPEYALEGYELNIVDYLIKPVSFERFLKAYQKAEKLMQAGYSIPGNERNYIFIKTGYRFEKLKFSDINYIESMLNYIKIFTKSKTYITYSSLKGIEKELPDDKFIKIHKSFIVSLSKITSLHGNQICLNDIKLPISRNLKKKVYKLVLKGLE